MFEDSSRDSGRGRGGRGRGRVQHRETRPPHDEEPPAPAVAVPPLHSDAFPALSEPTQHVTAAISYSRTIGPLASDFPALASTHAPAPAQPAPRATARAVAPSIVSASDDFPSLPSAPRARPAALRTHSKHTPAPAARTAPAPRSDAKPDPVRQSVPEYDDFPSMGASRAAVAHALPQRTSSVALVPAPAAQPMPPAPAAQLHAADFPSLGGSAKQGAATWGTGSCIGVPCVHVPYPSQPPRPPRPRSRSRCRPMRSFCRHRSAWTGARRSWLPSRCVCGTSHYTCAHVPAVPPVRGCADVLQRGLHFLPERRHYGRRTRRRLHPAVWRRRG